MLVERRHPPLDIGVLEAADLDGVANNSPLPLSLVVKHRAQHLAVTEGGVLGVWYVISYLGTYIYICIYMGIYIYIYSVSFSSYCNGNILPLLLLCSIRII